MKFSEAHRKIVYEVADLQMPMNECMTWFFSYKFVGNNEKDTMRLYFLF